MLKRSSELMEKHGLPPGDYYTLPGSRQTFPDGTHYKIEISGIERPLTLRAMVDEMKARKVPVHRIVATVAGSTYLDDSELDYMLKLSKKHKIETIITPGPRTPWDIGRQLSTPEGALSGIRVRGSDNLGYLIDEILRCIDLGFRGFLVLDEGVLYLLNLMRAMGDIPKDCFFKVSIYTGHANAAGALVLEQLGANSFNPVADLTLPMIASIRDAITIPMDIHVLIADSFGGINRMHETPEIARIASPCYFKLEPGPSLCIAGGLYKPWTSDEALSQLAREKVKYAGRIIQMVKQQHPELKVK